MRRLAVALVIAGCAPRVVHLSYHHELEPDGTRLHLDLALARGGATLVERRERHEDGGWFVAEPMHTYRGAARLLADGGLRLDLREDGADWEFHATCVRSSLVLNPDDGTETPVWVCGQWTYTTASGQERIIDHDISLSRARWLHVHTTRCLPAVEPGQTPYCSDWTEIKPLDHAAM
jgi:hypothetical protein